MNLNRNFAPRSNKIEILNFPEFKKTAIKDGINFFSVKAGSQAVIRLDFVFDAGLIKQSKKAEGFLTAAMLSEGTAFKTALQIAEKLDYFGSYFQAKCTADDAVVSLYCLDKHLQNCLPLFLETIIESAFPNNELDILIKTNVQKLLVSQRKNGYLCRKTFSEKLFGKTHPYAAFSEKTDIENVNRQDLVNFHADNYLTGLKYIVLAGNYTSETEELIKKLIVNSSILNTMANKTIIPQIETEIGKNQISKPDSVQSAVRIGNISIARNHPEFQKLRLLNMVFGGYFGSRLMKNIREKKGLTYGIYSAIDPMKFGSCWYIETDMNNKNQKNGLEEIYNEIEIITNNLIGEEELKVAKNYFMGSFLRSLDGPFSLADRIKVLIDNDLPIEYYTNFEDKLISISSDDLLDVAKKHFNVESFVEVVVGKP